MSRLADTPRPYHWVYLSFFWCVRQQGSLSDEPQDLIGGERNDAEHEMAHHFGVTAYSYYPGSELVFQPRVHSLHRRTFLITHIFRCSALQQSASFLLRLQLRLPRRIPARVGIDQRYVSHAAAVLLDSLCIIGRVHHVIEIRDPAR